MEKTYKLQLWLIAIGVLVLAIVGLAGFFMSLQAQVSLSPPGIVYGENMLTCPQECAYTWEDCVKPVSFGGCISLAMQAYHLCMMSEIAEAQCQAELAEALAAQGKCPDIGEKALQLITQCEDSYQECLLGCPVM